MQPGCRMVRLSLRHVIDDGVHKSRVVLENLFVHASER